MKIAIVAGGFTPGEADRLRRAMASFRNHGTIGKFRDKMISGMLARGYERQFAERCFSQIEGFADYGFPESHAASFALLVYVSCWLKCHYPDVFACALLNSQPMGFYAPAQIVRDAREHGVEVRPADVNLSDMDNVLEDGGGRRAADHIWPRHREMEGDIRSTHAVRLGFCQVKGLSREDAALIVARRGRGYDSVRDVWLRTGLPSAVMEKLAGADLFGSLGLDRRAALWAVRGLKGADGAETLPLFAAAERPRHVAEPDAALPPMPPGEAVIHDYKSLSLSLKAHPVRFLRDALRAHGILTTEEMNATPHGRIVSTAGLVLVRQRPGTSRVIFETLEDETGVANVVVWPKLFEANRRVVLGARLLGVKGQVQKEGLVVHLVARELFDYTPALLAIADGEDLGSAALSRATQRYAPNGSLAQARFSPLSQEGRQAHAALPSGRNFH